MIKSLVFLFALLTSFASQATFLQNIEIREITAFSTDIAFVKTATIATPTAANCATQGHTGEWAIPLNTDSGKAMYSLLLAAASQGKKIDIAGGSVGCDLINNRETAILIKVKY